MTNVTVRQSVTASSADVVQDLGVNVGNRSYKRTTTLFRSDQVQPCQPPTTASGPCISSLWIIMTHPDPLHSEEQAGGPQLHRFSSA